MSHILKQNKEREDGLPLCRGGVTISASHFTLLSMRMQERTHRVFLPLVIISISLYFIFVEELVDGCHHCTQSLIQKQNEMNMLYYQKGEDVCTEGDSLATVSSIRRHKKALLQQYMLSQS